MGYDSGGRDSNHAAPGRIRHRDQTGHAFRAHTVLHWTHQSDPCLEQHNWNAYPRPSTRLGAPRGYQPRQRGGRGSDRQHKTLALAERLYALLSAQVLDGGNRPAQVPHCPRGSGSTSSGQRSHPHSSISMSGVGALDGSPPSYAGNC
eukprot:479931-Rhodomonas_salina.3